MRLKTAVVIICLITAILVMSGGYSRWQDRLRIEGTITVTIPEP